MIVLVDQRLESDIEMVHGAERADQIEAPFAPGAPETLQDVASCYRGLTNVFPRSRASAHRLATLTTATLRLLGSCQVDL